MAGAGVARDLALRGASVALFEKGDFASGTTSKSSKLIHGGLRYLELFDFELVRESLREQKTLERLAPHLVRPLPFLVPIYPRVLARAHQGADRHVALRPAHARQGRRALPRAAARSTRSRWSPTSAPRTCAAPATTSTTCCSSPSGCAWRTSCRRAATARASTTTAEVEEIVRGARGARRACGCAICSPAGVHAARRASSSTAPGPWVDRLRALAGVHERGPRMLRTTKGIHCLLPAHDRARDLPRPTHDDRMIFVIPWRGLLAGGHDRHRFRRRSRPALGHPRRGDVPARRGAPGPARSGASTLDDVAYTYAGVRPLSFEEGARASEVSREHKVVAEGPGGRFLSVTGTKLTCFRSLAEEVGDRVMRALGRRAPSPHRAAQPGRRRRRGRGGSRRARGMDVSEEMAAHGLPPRDARGPGGHLRPRLPAGARAGREAARRHRAPLPDESRDRGPAPSRGAARSWRSRCRTCSCGAPGIGQSRCQGLDCAESIGRRMAELLGWSPRRLDAELDAYRQHVARSRASG